MTRRQSLHVSRGAIAAVLLVLAAHVGAVATAADRPQPEPLRIIFDTDMGNDIDDALALSVIHALQSRGECQLLGVTISKDNPHCAAFIDVVNEFYGRGAIPIGMIRDGKEKEDGKFVRQVSQARDGGKLRYPHDLASGDDAPEAVSLLRRLLAASPEKSVVLVVVGFSTNIARLLDSGPDSASPLSGRELVARHCRLLSMMAGMFADPRQKEYNVYIDLPSAKKIFAEWPGEIVASGFEIGLAIKYPAASIEHDFGYVAHHPVQEAYTLYMQMPYDRETWDLTSVLYAVRPARGYFGLSAPGKITTDEQGITHFTAAKKGRHRYLTVDAEQISRVREALVQLASQPPGH